ncbi:MAG: N-acetylmuramoyl-L-alanine amidase [bacterium]
MRPDSLIGKTCPYCQTPFKQGVQIATCDQCQMPHHSECWRDNGGCTTFACQGNSVEGIELNNNRQNENIPRDTPISSPRGNKSNVIATLVGALIIAAAIIVSSNQHNAPNSSGGSETSTSVPTPVAPSPVGQTPQPPYSASISLSVYPKPSIVSRADWGAKDPLPGMMVAHTPTRITIGHSGIFRNEGYRLTEKMRNLQRYSQKIAILSRVRTKPVWADVPYHFFIDFNGQIAEGRDIVYASDTLTNYDPNGHILISLEGNFEIEQPNEAQIDALRELVCWLAINYAIPSSEIRGHKDYALTASPGRNLQDLIPTLRTDVDAAASTHNTAE